MGSNLVLHARQELERIGEEPETIEWYLKVIQAFADYGHSGESTSVCIPTLNDLLQFKNLSPLTNDPKEWIMHAPEVVGVESGVWQSVRNSEAFSNDGGNHYYLLSEGGRFTHPYPLHETVKK